VGVGAEGDLDGAGEGKLVLNGGILDLAGPSIDVTTLSIADNTATAFALTFGDKAITARKMYVGNYGAGTFNQKGGSTTVTERLYVGTCGASAGWLTQSGGSIAPAGAR